MKKTIVALSAIALAVSIQAETISVTDGTANDYGKTSGVAIDFDATTGLSADWSPDLVAGQQYRVDSVSLFLGGQGAINEDLYLGVYTGFDEQLGTQGSATLSGFLGVSDNTFNLSTAALDTALTWTFSGNGFLVTSESTPGAGGDVLYFMLQTGTGALTDTGSIQSDDRPFRRVDGYPDTTAFGDYLSATIHGNRNESLNDADLVPSRPLEYEAQITVVSAPTGDVDDLMISGPVAGDMELSWTGEASGTYAVQTNLDLSTTNWGMLMTGIPGTAGTIVTNTPVGPDQVFYKVIPE